MALHLNEPPAESRETRRITLAIGLFDRVVSLACVLRDLASHGYDSGKFHIVVADDSQWFPSRGAGPLEDAVPICRVPVLDLREGAPPAVWLKRTLPWLADHPPAEGRSQNSDADHVARGAASSVLDRQIRRIVVHLASGGAAMIARIDAISDQQAICSMMLHYANGGVLTHQIRAGSTGDWPSIGSPATHAAPAAFRCT